MKIYLIPLIGVMTFGCGDSTSSIGDNSRPLSTTIPGAGSYACRGLLEAYEDLDSSAGELMFQVGVDCLRAGDSFGFDTVLDEDEAIALLNGVLVPYDAGRDSATYRDAAGTQVSRTIQLRTTGASASRFELEIVLGDSASVVEVGLVGDWPPLRCRLPATVDGGDVYDTTFQTSFCERVLDVLDIDRFSNIAP